MIEGKEQVSVLIIEDDEDDYYIARSLLSKTTGVVCKLDWERDYAAGLHALLAKAYDVCLVDYRLGARDGLQLLQEANDLGVDTPLILLTGQGDYQVDLQAMMAGASDYLVKGQIDAQLLERSIRYARERKRAEERIREQAALLDKARDMICAYDLNRRVIYWNKSAERLTGYGTVEMSGVTVDGGLYADADKIEEVWEAVLARGEWTGDLRQVTRSGEELIVESRWTLVRDGVGNPRSVLVINTDVTERKRLEAHFLRSQRMESIGTLVGGIAHDLGNLLVPILLGVKILGNRYEDDPKTARTLEMIGRSAQRGSDMVKQVLAFARGVEGERVQLHVEDVVREVEKIAAETFPADVRVQVEINGDLRPVMGDSTQVQQVLMNLCLNARDAMPEGGVLRIETATLTLSEEDLSLYPDARPGTYGMIRVADTGTGIPAPVLDKVFEPFYTTKPAGQGTGLGLSTVYSIVKSHGGFVHVESAEGEGSVFSVCIPVADVAVAHPEANDGPDIPAGAGETILLVDDEEFIIDTVGEILADAGYHVITASDGREAIERFDREAGPIHLVITDLMMPEIDGFELIRQIRQRTDDVPIIAATGMAVSKSQAALAAGANLFITKPFTAEKLISAARQALLKPEQHHVVRS